MREIRRCGFNNRKHKSCEIAVKGNRKWKGLMTTAGTRHVIEKEKSEPETETETETRFEVVRRWEAKGFSFSS